MPRAGTKQALLLSQLHQTDGISIRELAQQTGWKCNTVHAALSTLRARGYQLIVKECQGVKRYFIASE